MSAVKGDPGLRLQVAACGMHLSEEHGYTVAEVEHDFTVDARVEMLLSADTESAATKAVGLGCIGFADAFDRLRPSAVVLLGDRFELLAPAVAAMMARIPIVHIHGGELTLGAVDDSVRHAVTKMASLHFPSTEEYRRRIIQMGEEPWRVTTVGAPALERLEHIAVLSKEQWGARLGFRLPPPIALVTYHPATLLADETEKECDEVLAAIRSTGVSAIVTGSNADPRGRAINRRLREFCASSPDRFQFVENLGMETYASCMQHCDLMIGNSSSGIIEAPSFALPVVNVGNRQQGRVRARNVIDTPGSSDAIASAIHRALTSDFRSSLKGLKNPYAAPGEGSISGRMKDQIRAALTRPDFVRKRFQDFLAGGTP